MACAANTTIPLAELFYKYPLPTQPGSWQTGGCTVPGKTDILTLNIGTTNIPSTVTGVNATAHAIYTSSETSEGAADPSDMLGGACLWWQHVPDHPTALHLRTAVAHHPCPG